MSCTAGTAAGNTDRPRAACHLWHAHRMPSCKGMASSGGAMLASRLVQWFDPSRRAQARNSMPSALGVGSLPASQPYGLPLHATQVSLVEPCKRRASSRRADFDQCSLLVPLRPVEHTSGAVPERQRMIVSYPTFPLPTSQGQPINRPDETQTLNLAKSSR